MLNIVFQVEEEENKKKQKKIENNNCAAKVMQKTEKFHRFYFNSYIHKK